LGPLGRDVPVRALAAEPLRLLSSRTFWANSRLLKSGLIWRAKVAAAVFVLLAVFPCLLRASRRASTKARLGLCCAVPLRVVVRLAGVAAAPRPLLRESVVVLVTRLARLLFVGASPRVSWHLQGF
jgi:hypothetical protein